MSNKDEILWAVMGILLGIALIALMVGATLALLLTGFYWWAVLTSILILVTRRVIIKIHESTE